MIWIGDISEFEFKTKQNKPISFHLEGVVLFPNPICNISSFNSPNTFPKELKIKIKLENKIKIQKGN
jgi:hypothetical protein